ncbi:N-succinylarginine dihydrolase [Caulobacter vibrioides]|uniref:N-succinylarginine dihydrolase n=1 Tax=Caulobacter vibrioides TaxID=155892 RepID=UPI000BB51AE7|nr:N-succinylarginine dihydrolase [Caulobacter vibrioides]ATC23582.1 N-succinylarginine dihydrolase [Caulobacter vibrioides]AZH11806.1 N-succinylarginine dihydrolase [Caulobacter vibrioides]PLR11825.1 N-succinylarginine dihydrolase [Caulobacter vibrioides]
MTLEINFDGLIGPTHNYAGLSLGNIASHSNAGAVSSPRAAALQGLTKMRTLLDLGLTQGFLPPPPRPAAHVLRRLGFKGSDQAVLAQVADEDLDLLRAASSASSMWTANAATVLAAPDTADGRVHLVTANLGTMIHRSLEADDTYATLRRVFSGEAFAVHAPLPFAAHLGDEGAANHMRLAANHGARGVNVFVHGAPRGGRFPERQALRASQAAARLAGVQPAALFAMQSAEAIKAGAFHNDVVAVANANVLLAHPQAFATRPDLLAELSARLPGLVVIETRDLSLEDAVASYLFNSQLVSLPDGDMALIVPVEARDNAAAWREIQTILAADNPVTKVKVVDLRQSMSNGGGPACLRLRVPVAAAARDQINPAFLLDHARLDRLTRLVETWWPRAIAPSDLTDPALWEAAMVAHAALETFLTAPTV